MKCSLTILIPTYNRWPILVENVKLLEQIRQKSELFEIEILIVDNHSYALDQLRGVELNFPNIKFIQNVSNMGAPFSIAKALTQISTEYVMVLGDDDFLDFSIFCEVLTNLQASACDVLLFSETSNTKQLTEITDIDQHMAEHPRPNEYIFLSTTIYRTSFLVRHLEALGHGLNAGIPLTLLSCAHNHSIVRYDVSPFLKRHVNQDEENEWHPIEVYIDSIFDYIWNYRVISKFDARLKIAQNLRKNWLNDRILIWSILRSTEKQKFTTKFLLYRILGLLFFIDGPIKFWTITMPLVTITIILRRQLNGIRLHYQKKGS